MEIMVKLKVRLQLEFKNTSWNWAQLSLSHAKLGTCVRIQAETQAGIQLNSAQANPELSTIEIFIVPI